MNIPSLLLLFKVFQTSLFNFLMRKKTEQNDGKRNVQIEGRGAAVVPRG
jgi:hypothetical protein